MTKCYPFVFLFRNKEQRVWSAWHWIKVDKIGRVCYDVSNIEKNDNAEKNFR